MKHDLDQQLEKINMDIEWKEERLHKVKQQLFSKLTPSKTNTWIRKWVLPTVLLLLLMSLIPAYFFQAGENQKNAAEKASEKNIRVTEGQLKELKADGIPLLLPNYSPVSDTKLNTLTKHRSQTGYNVTAAFSAKGEALFTVTINDLDASGNKGLSKAIGRREEEIKKAGNVVNGVGGKRGYFIRKDSGYKYNLYIYTAKEGIVISSHKIGKTGLIEIAESINW